MRHSASFVCLSLFMISDARSQPPLETDLTFHASFDGKAYADRALGDPKIYHGGAEGLRADVTIEPGGRHGDCLRFGRKTEPWVLFRGGKNVHYDVTRFQGTVSFWLSLDPEKDLEPGYCDPISITDKGWNDACFFAEFTKDEVPRHFNLGVFTDNPKDRPFENRPPSERPLINVPKHPFGKDRWTHVAFTWDNFNTGKEDGVARLYLDGTPAGERKGAQAFTWDPGKVRIELGLSYIGRFDDLAIFSRALSAAEIASIGALPGGIRGLYSKEAPTVNTPAPSTSKYATIATSMGDIVIEFKPDVAPKTVENFVTLAKKGYYDNLTFHRIIPGFMMQGGCPTGDGTGGPGYTIKAEFNATKHVAGTVSMARTADPDSAGSQFFICFAPAPHLDGQYTAFAQVVKGLDVVKKIEPAGSSSGRPKQKVQLVKVTLSEKLP